MHLRFKIWVSSTKNMTQPQYGTTRITSPFERFEFWVSPQRDTKNRGHLYLSHGRP